MLARQKTNATLNRRKLPCVHNKRRPDSESNCVNSRQEHAKLKPSIELRRSKSSHYAVDIESKKHSARFLSGRRRRLSQWRRVVSNPSPHRK